MLPGMNARDHRRTGISVTRVLIALAGLAVAASAMATLWDHDLQSKRNPRALRFAGEIVRGSSAEQAVVLARSEGANVAFAGSKLFVLFPHEKPVEVDLVAGRITAIVLAYPD